MSTTPMPPQTSNQLLLTFPAEHVLLLTLNRPEQMNAMTPGMQDDLRRVLNWFEDGGSYALALPSKKAGRGGVFRRRYDSEEARRRSNANQIDIVVRCAPHHATSSVTGSQSRKNSKPHHVLFLPTASVWAGSALRGTGIPSMLLQLICVGELGKAKPTPISGRREGSVKVERSSSRLDPWNTDQQTGVSNEQESVVSNVYGFGSISRRHSKKPMIAAVNGKGAYGGGMEMVLNCDYVVAGEEARFALPEVKRGVIAVQGVTLSLFDSKEELTGSRGSAKLLDITYVNYVFSVHPSEGSHSLIGRSLAPSPPPNGTGTPSGFPLSLLSGRTDTSPTHLRRSLVAMTSLTRNGRL
ncbi:hypothetical protein NMY22_g17355 [Coprinellus aureogranulatus]|nr:hypothetical protein NMY22_g17355 [Coprinellus aureogranulatus]